MIPPYTYAAARLAEERRDELQYQMDQERRVDGAQSSRIIWIDRALGWLGALMVCCGERLVARSVDLRMGLRQPLVK